MKKILTIDLNKLNDTEKSILKNLTDKCEISRKQLGDFKPGETAKIGKREFIVLEHVCGGVTKLITKDPFKKNVMFDNDVPNYSESEIKKLIDFEFVPELEEAVGKDNVISFNMDLTTLDGLHRFEEVSDCKAGLMSFDDYRRHIELVHKCVNYWWTCTPWSTEEYGNGYSIAVVSPLGAIDEYTCYNDFGVRPICILKSKIFVRQGDA